MLQVQYTSTGTWAGEYRRSFADALDIPVPYCSMVQVGKLEEFSLPRVGYSGDDTGVHLRTSRFCWYHTRKHLLLMNFSKGL